MCETVHFYSSKFLLPWLHLPIRKLADYAVSYYTNNDGNTPLLMQKLINNVQIWMGKEKSHIYYLIAYHFYVILVPDNTQLLGYAGNRYLYFDAKL